MNLTDVIKEDVSQNEIPEVYEAAMYQYAVYMNRQLSLEEIKCFEVIDCNDFDVIKLAIIGRIRQVVYEYLIEYDEKYHMFTASIADTENKNSRQYGLGSSPAMAMQSFENIVEGYLDMILELNLPLTFQEMIEGINNDQAAWEKRRRKFQDDQVIHRCSLCAKPERDVDELVECNNEIYICNDCINEMNSIINNK